MDPFSARAVAAAYDAVADDYATTFAGDLHRLPLDRAVLDGLAQSAAGAGPVIDVGCGPGQVSDYLHQHGVEVIGIDIAPRMLAAARLRAPALAWSAGDMRSLPLRSTSCTGAVLFYSLQYIPRAAMPSVLAELRRVLRPEAHLVIAAHLGAGEVVHTELLGHAFQPVGATFYEVEELERALVEQAFTVEACRLRGALPHEHPSQRIYLTARAVG